MALEFKVKSKSKVLKAPASSSANSSSSSGVSKTSASCSESWLTKHHPQTLERVAEVTHVNARNFLRGWLTQSCKAHAEQDEVRNFRPKVLALCGPSGCAKSTLVEVLCKDLDIDVVVWHDEMWDAEASSSLLSERQFAPPHDRLFAGHQETSHPSTWEEKRSRAQEMEEFVLQSKYPKLLFRSSSSGSSSGSGSASQNGSGSARLDPNLVKASDLAPTVPGREFDSSWRRIVLIHDPQRLEFGASGPRARQHRDLSSLLAKFRDPVVLIVSDVGNDDVKYAVASIIPPSIRHKIELEERFQQSITVLNIEKALRRICSQEGCSDVPAALIEGIAESSCGDLRHAVLQLQLAVQSSRAVGSFGCDLSFARSSLCLLQSGLGVADKKVGAGSKRSRETGGVAIRGEDSEGAVMILDAEGGKTRPQQRIARRDLKYSSLHSAAKVTNAKLDLEGRARDSEGGQYCVDQVVYKSELDTQLLAAFVQSNIVKSIETSFLKEKKGCASARSQLALISAPPAPFPGTGDEPPPSKRPASSFSSSSSSSSLLDLGGDRSSLSHPSDQPSPFPWCLEDRAREMEQVSLALALCSDLEMLLAPKYDPSAHLDRANNAYPDEYVSCLLARVGCVARGPGSFERNKAGKDAGAKGSLQGMLRPKVFNLRGDRMGIEEQLSALREELVVTGGCPLVPVEQLAWAVPFMQFLAEADLLAAEATSHRRPAPVVAGQQQQQRFGPAVRQRLAFLRRPLRSLNDATENTIPSATGEDDEVSEGLATTVPVATSIEPAPETDDLVEDIGEFLD